MTELNRDLSVDAVVCAYTLDRAEQLFDAVASLQAQTRPLCRIVVVIDHNTELEARARQRLEARAADRLQAQARQPAAARADVVVVANSAARGLSGARNSGVAACSADIVAFLDDDAVAEPEWVERLLAAYATGPTTGHATGGATGDAAGDAVVGTGGNARPVWSSGRAPGWFPPEFGWVVGCSYTGQPTVTGPVRNPLGCSMSFRRRELQAVGGFTEGTGRVGGLPRGCEETEAAIRLRAAAPGALVILEPAAVVHHVVTPERERFGYFLRRCRAEGESKALLAALTDPVSALSSERAYVTRTLPRGIRTGLAAGLRGERDGWLRAGAILAGLGATTAGYAQGRLTLRRTGLPGLGVETARLPELLPAGGVPRS